jgi:hypothetical protein
MTLFVETDSVTCRIHHSKIIMVMTSIALGWNQLGAFQGNCHRLSQLWTGDASIEEQKPGQLVVLSTRI